MADTSGARDLGLWSFATFHAVTFVVAVALALHLKGVLPGALKQLDTSIGFAFFAFLWTTTWFTTRIGRRYQAREQAASAGLDTVVPATIVAAGWNGVFVWVALVIARIFVFGPALALNGRAVVAFAFALAIGSPIAFVVGGFVGVLYGLGDRLLLSLSAALFRWTNLTAESA